MEHQKHHPTKSATQKPVFRLYVSGATSKSIKAVVNAKCLLDHLFNGNFDLRVIDIYQEPRKAKAARVVAVPLLIREYPLPACRVIGDFYSKGDIQCLLSTGNQHRNVRERDGKQSQN